MGRLRWSPCEETDPEALWGTHHVARTHAVEWAAEGGEMSGRTGELTRRKAAGSRLSCLCVALPGHWGPAVVETLEGPLVLAPLVSGWKDWDPRQLSALSQFEPHGTWRTLIYLRFQHPEVVARWTSGPGRSRRPGRCLPSACRRISSDSHATPHRHLRRHSVCSYGLVCPFKRLQGKLLDVRLSRNVVRYGIVVRLLLLGLLQLAHEIDCVHLAFFIGLVQFLGEDLLENVVLACCGSARVGEGKSDAEYFTYTNTTPPA